MSLVVAGGTLWIGCDEVVRMLPNGRVVKRVKIPADVLAAGEGAVWATGETGVLTGRGDSLLREFDPVTASVRSTTKLEAGVANLAAGLGAIWVVRITDDSITRVDTRTRESTEGFAVRIPELVTTGAGAVWVTSARDGTVTRYDPRNADLKTIDVGGTPTGIAVTREAVWVPVEAV